MADTNKEFFNELIEVKLNKPFLVIMETLTRIGIANHDTKTLTQSCHIFYFENRYYLAHFKTLFGIYKGQSTFDTADKIRLNSIASILSNWKMIEILDFEKLDSEINTNNIFILPFPEKDKWTLKQMFVIPERERDSVTVTVISDTHGMHSQIKLPEKTDILIHCGDFMNSGVKIQELKSFADWLDEIRFNYEKVLIIAGNHDILFEDDENIHNEITDYNTNNVFYLKNSGFTYKGWKFWGSPCTPRFRDWAFNRSPEELEIIWNMIPQDIDVLLSHGPPKGFCDTISKIQNEPLGCPKLANRIQDLKKLKFHCFGHIHGGYGKYSYNGVTYINASVCTEKYQPYNRPHIFTLED